MKWPILSDEFRFVATIVGLLIGVVVVFGTILERVTLSAESVRIEQLREDITKIGCSASEDVVGQATEMNQLIREKQLWSKHFIAGPLYPNRWNEIEVIELPDCS